MTTETTEMHDAAPAAPVSQAVEHRYLCDDCQVPRTTEVAYEFGACDGCGSPKYVRDMHAPTPELMRVSGTVTTPAAPPAPSFLDDIEEDIRADFAAVGIELSPDQADLVILPQAQRDAMAAMFLRRMGELDADADALKATMLLQLQLIQQHYERVVSGPTRQRAFYARQVEYLASVSQFGGRKKSAVTPFGSYGRKDYAPTVELANPDDAIAWARVSRPELVKVTAKLPFAEASEYLSESELAACKQDLAWGDLKKQLDPAGDLPPGVAAVPAKSVYFAAPITQAAPVGGAA